MGRCGSGWADASLGATSSGGAATSARLRGPQEGSMSSQALTPYHIANQQASVLLGPVAAELAVLEARLAHYHDRLRMADADRATIARARDVLARVRAELASLPAAAQE